MAVIFCSFGKYLFYMSLVLIIGGCGKPENQNTINGGNNSQTTPPAEKPSNPKFVYLDFTKDKDTSLPFEFIVLEGNVKDVYQTPEGRLAIRRPNPRKQYIVMVDFGSKYYKSIFILSSDSGACGSREFRLEMATSKIISSCYRQNKLFAIEGAGQIEPIQFKF